MQDDSQSAPGIPVSIVIPARNEENRLPASIQAIRSFFPDAPWEFLIVIEPGVDQTAAAVKQSISGDTRFRVIANPVPRGKGFAVKTGMMLAEGEWIFFMDADLSVPLSFVEKFLAQPGRADVLAGSRRHRGSRILQHQSWTREVAGRIFNHGLKLIGATRFSDTQCGFKAFRKTAAHSVFSILEQDGFGFDVEALLLADALGFRIQELPVDWSDVQGSKVNPVRDGIAAYLQAIRTVLRVRKKFPR